MPDTLSGTFKELFDSLDLHIEKIEADQHATNSNALDRATYQRHYQQLSPVKDITCLKFNARCDITGQRLFLKKCVKVRVQPTPHYLVEHNNDHVSKKKPKYIYMDKVEYFLEKLRIPSKDNINYII